MSSKALKIVFIATLTMIGLSRPLFAADPQLSKDIAELKKARAESSHIRWILKHTGDKYGMGGEWTASEKSLDQLEHHIDKAVEVVNKQIASGK